MSGLVLYFNNNRRLKSIERFSLKDGKKFDLSNEKTELRDEEKSLINKLFSNVGIGGTKIN